MVYITFREVISAEKLYYNKENYFWQGGLATVKRLTLEEFEKCIDYLSGWEIDATELNDFFWFEDDRVIEIVERDIWEDKDEDNS